MKDKNPKIAVITPFLDKQHGSERCLAEQIERIASHFEVYIYAHYVKDINLSSSNIFVRRIPQIPGPHILKYLWFFIANHIWRGYDSVFRGLRYPVRYSPCINCLDANVISVHIVFHAFYEAVKDKLRLKQVPFYSWPKVIHRWLYYHLIMLLERWLYRNQNVLMICVSQQVRQDMKRYFKRSTVKDFVIYHGIDSSYFNPTSRQMRRDIERSKLGISNDEFVLLLIGNDWLKKGLLTLIDAMELLHNPKLKALIVGQDDQLSFEERISCAEIKDQVLFFSPHNDVLQFYAAADAYIAPSLEDAFAIPPLEAMACGLPVVVSRRAGVSELITDECDGLILEDPSDAHELAVKIQRLYENTKLRQTLGENGRETAERYTWNYNAERLMQIFELILKKNSAHKEATILII